MINTLSLEIPQVKVFPQESSSSVSKKWLPELEQYFLSSYLDAKVRELSITHHWLNEMIRDVWLIHGASYEQRMGEESYSQDVEHYRQLIQTRTIADTIARLTGELLYCLYYMKYIKDHNQLPEGTDLSTASRHLLNHGDTKDELSIFAAFIRQTAIIRFAQGLNIIFPNTRIMFVEERPVYFVVTGAGEVASYALGDLIDEYNRFFIGCIKSLERHSPVGIGYSLRRWIDEKENV